MAVGVVILPIAYIVVRATDRGWQAVEDTLWRPRTLELVVRSLGMAAAVTTASLAVGIGAAWLVARSDLPGRQVFRVMLAMPLALPSYVAAWAWIGFRPELAGARGAFLVLVTISYPYVYLPVLAALRRIDPALEEVARASGRGPWSVFFSVTLRQLRIAVVGGGSLVALYVLSEFGAVSIMRFESLTQVIYRSYRASFDRTPAAVLGCVLVAITIIPLALTTRFGDVGRLAKVGSGTVRTAPPVRLGWARWPLAALIAALLGASLGVPAWNLVRWTRRGRSTVDWSELRDATVSTLGVSAMAAVATVVVAMPVGILAARHAGRLSRATTVAAYAGHALPGIVVALSLVFFGIRYATPIYQRTPMLVASYVVLFLSLAIGAIHSSVAQAPPVLDDVARSLGRTQWGVWRGLTARLAAPGIGAGATLVFIASMKELPATLLLRPIGMDTLATRLWTFTDNASYAAAAPYAAALVLVAAIPTAALTGARLGRA